MIPTVASPTSLDVYRDGGSLSVSFRDSNDTEHTLFFPVRLSVGAPRRFERVGYFPPKLERFIRTPRISHITGLESVDTTKETDSVSWEEAKQILSQLSPLISQLQTQYAYVFPEMLEVAANNGALPPNA